MAWEERLRGWAARHRHEILLVWLGLALLFAHPADGHLRGDSLRYAALMREMLRSGDWLTPTLYGEPYFNKPPLFFWYGASVLSVLGATTFAARVVGVLPAIGLLLATYHLVRRLADPRTALVAAAVLGTSSVFVRNSGEPRLDAALALCHVLAVAAAVVGEERPRRLPWFWVAVGAGVAIKGPAGLLPIGILALWSLARRSAHPWNRGWFWAGLPALPLLVAPWLVHHWLVHGERFVDAYFHEDLGESIDGVGATVGPVRKYLSDLALEWWPWIPFMLHGAWRAARRLRAAPATDAASRSGPLALAWCVAVALSVLPIGRPYSRYLLPAVPAAAALAADSLTALFPVAIERWWERSLGWVLAAATAILAFGPVRPHSSEVPDAVRFAPYLEARGADRPVRALGTHVRRRFHEAAIFYEDREVRLVAPSALLDELSADGPGASRTVVVSRSETVETPGLVLTTVLEGREVDLVEVRRK